MVVDILLVGLDLADLRGQLVVDNLLGDLRDVLGTERVGARSRLEGLVDLAASTSPLDVSQAGSATRECGECARAGR